MNKLQTVSNQEYDFVLQSYKKIVNDFILRTNDDAPEKFIGGIPINLKREDFKNLLDRSYSYPDYKYTSTPKVDGSRFLLFITESSPNSKEKTFYFIDRALNIYNIINKSGIKLDKFNMPKMLIDGEMTFVKDNKYTYLLPQVETEYLCFMVFDILYGPSDVYFQDAFVDKRAKYRESVSMAGTKGGKLWDYNKRYNLLQKLLIPTPENNNYPGLTMSVAESSNFFRIELKQILQIKYLADVGDVEKFVYTEYENNRKKLYTFLDSQITEPKMLKVNKALMRAKLSYDGIIFTPLDTEYITGNWTGFKNNQYKWKPANEQTIDFAVKNTGRFVTTSETSVKQQLVELYFRRFDAEKNKEFLILFKLNNNPTFGLIPEGVKVSDEVVCEFRFNIKSNYFIFVRTREGKSANGIRSALAAIKLAKEPIDINILSEYFSTKKTDNTFKKLSKYLSKKQIIQLLICADKVDYLSKDNRIVINNQINKTLENPLNEFRMVFGTIYNTNLFNKTINNIIYNNISIMFEILKWKKETVLEIEITKGDVMTKYRYFNELKDIVRISSDKIINTVSTIINLTSAIDNDLEIESIEKVDSEEKILDINNSDTKYKYERIIYYDPNKVFQVVIGKKWIATSLSIEPETSKFTYEAYILATDLNSLNMNNVDNFLRFYLNF